MIAVDTSALMAVVLDEPAAAAYSTALAGAAAILVSAGTAAEALIVAGCRHVGPAMQRLIKGGRDSPGYGDCFAYALARQRGCPLLFVGKDFAKTDVAHAAGALRRPAG